MDETQAILNPMAPMAYMLPETGTTLRVASYMVVGCLGAFLWDILENVHSDYRLLFEHKMSFPTFVYFFSRVCVLTLAVICAFLCAAPLGLHNCRNIMLAICAFYHVTFSSTTFLFLLRVRAIYNHDKCIVSIFAVLWGSVIGGSLVVALTRAVEVIGPTDYCLPGNLKPYISAAPISLFVNDTCVFIAISWRLLQSSWVAPQDKASSSTWRHLVLGHHLPLFTRALLQDGQAYYLFSVIVNLASAAIVFLSSVPRFTYVLNSVITNMMVCRVYRRTKLGDIREKAISTTFIEAQAGGQLNLNFACTSQPIGRSDDGDSLNTTDSKSKGEWYEDWRSKVLLAVILGCMILIPVICATVCVHTPHIKHIR